MDGIKLMMNLTYLSPALCLIGVVLGAIRLKKLHQVFQLITLFLLLSFITDLVYRYFAIFPIKRFNLFLIPIYGLFELLLFSFLYLRYLIQGKKTGLIIFIGLMAIGILFEIFFAPYIYSAKEFISFGKPLANLGILVLCFFTFYHWITGNTPKEPAFYPLNGAIFIYYSLNLLLYLFINFLVNENITLVTIFWVINLISVLIFYSILIYFLWQNGKIRK